MHSSCESLADSTAEVEVAGVWVPYVELAIRVKSGSVEVVCGVR